MNGKDKAGVNGGPITVSLTENTENTSMSLVSTASVSHHHGQIHTTQPVSQHTVQQSVGTNIHQFDNQANPNNTTVPLVPVASSAALPPEKISSIAFHPAPSLPLTAEPTTVSVSACPPIR